MSGVFFIDIIITFAVRSAILCDYYFCKPGVGLLYSNGVLQSFFINKHYITSQGHGPLIHCTGLGESLLVKGPYSASYFSLNGLYILSSSSNFAIASVESGWVSRNNLNSNIAKDTEESFLRSISLSVFFIFLHTFFSVKRFI